MKITSVNNDLVKNTRKLLQKKYREETGLFILEGEKSLKEALDCGLKIIRAFGSEEKKEYNFEYIETTETVLSKITDTVSPPPIVAIAEKPNYKWENNFKKVVLLENIKDAGNLGTIIRTSAAFGVDAIVLFGNTVDLYNPKCVRSSVGNLWKIPVFEISEISDIREKFNEYERIATLPKSGKSVYLNDYTSPQEKVLVMFGSESEGLSETLKDFATKNVTIEMSKRVESLNLSISAGVILYKLFV